jgi:hypothetical protein
MPIRGLTLARPARLGGKITCSIEDRDVIHQYADIHDTLAILFRTFDRGSEEYTSSVWRLRIGYASLAWRRQPPNEKSYCFPIYKGANSVL